MFEYNKICQYLNINEANGINYIMYIEKIKKRILLEYKSNINNTTKYKNSHIN